MKRSLSTILPHLFFWGVSYLILYNIFSADYKLGASDIYYTILFHISILVVSYGNLILCRRFLNKNKILLYIPGALILIIIGIVIYYLTFNILADIVLPGYFFIAYYSWQEIGLFMLAYLLLTTLLFFTWQGIQLRELHMQRVSNQKTSQLEQLRKSINPHFLFNSLNNIYGSMNSADSSARNYIKKLSDTLRYMLYESEEPLIPLVNEIKYLEDYIALEKIRFENSDQIQFEQEGRLDGYLIPPLLLLPQVENCFKHCDVENPEINLHVKQENGILTLETKNRLDTGTKKEGGLGIQNLEKRLQLLYEDTYSFIRNDVGKYYHTRLSINLEA